MEAADDLSTNVSFSLTFTELILRFVESVLFNRDVIDSEVLAT